MHATKKICTAFAAFALSGITAVLLATFSGEAPGNSSMNGAQRGESHYAAEADDVTWGS